MQTFDAFITHLHVSQIMTNKEVGDRLHGLWTTKSIVFCFVWLVGYIL